MQTSMILPHSNGSRSSMYVQEDRRRAARGAVEEETGDESKSKHPSQAAR